MTRSSGYGYRVSAIRRSLTSGPYESAVSMKLTPSSTTRRSVALACPSSGGSPQMPLPVIRIAPKPIRRTTRSPPISMVPAAAPAELVMGNLPNVFASSRHAA
jgi:hypothetical protein